MSKHHKDMNASLRQKVREILPIIAEDAGAAERLTHLTPKVVQNLDEAGVFRIGMPLEFGGYALGARDQIDILADIAGADGSTGWVAWVGTTNFGNFGLAFPEQARSEMLAEAWVGPLIAGSVFSSHSSGSARAVDGGWMVTGKWGFCSNVRHAAWVVGSVPHQHGDGSVTRMTALLHRDQVEILDDWHVMGMAASNSNTVTTKIEQFVPAHRMIETSAITDALLADESGFSGALFQIDRLMTATVTNAGLALGMARRALDLFIGQGKKRIPFGLPYSTLSATPSVQVVAGKCEAMIGAAEALIYTVAEEIDQRGEKRERFEIEERFKFDARSTYAARLCAEAVDLMQLSLGASTAALANPFQRIVRDIRVLNLHGVHRLDISTENRGRALFGEPLHPLPF